MRQIANTALSIDALIQTGAIEAAQDLLRAELEPLSMHLGMARVESWCAALGMEALLDLPRAVAAAYALRETRGAMAIPAFAAIARNAQGSGDETTEFRALAGIFSTGTLIWSGFGEMERSFARINVLFEATRTRLTKNDAIECLPGLLAARMLFGERMTDSALIAETVATLVVDETLSGTARLRAATLLAPWFEHARDAARLRRMTDVLTPLTHDTSIPDETRLIYRSATALAGIYCASVTSEVVGGSFSSASLMADADSLGHPWLRFFTCRVEFEQASRTGDAAEASRLLEALDARVDPGDASQVLALRYRRGSSALHAHEYAATLGHGQRCRELARTLEMPQPIALLYDNLAAASLVGLHRFGEAKAIYLAMIANSMPGHRAGYERMCALIDVAEMLSGGAASEKLPAALDHYLAACAGRLPPLHASVFPRIAKVVVAALYAHGLGSEALDKDVRDLPLSPPEDRPITWPWVLRLRLFDGFVCEGLASNVQENNKKGGSKSQQILQYLAAFSPAAVSGQWIADALWPDVEGDKAMRSLDVALTRLRQVLPDPALLTRHEGKIGFDLDRVWCDTQAVLAHVERLREFANVGVMGSAEHRGAHSAITARAASVDAADALVRDTAQAQTTLALLALYRGPLLPDSREPLARDRAAYFRTQVAGGVQIGLRAATRLPDPTMAEEIVRKSVGHGLPADVVRSVLADMQARGSDTSRRAAQLTEVFELARG